MEMGAPNDRDHPTDFCTWQNGTLGEIEIFDVFYSKIYRS
jgi:hypothetical protein